jgi:hypothetical protein
MKGEQTMSSKIRSLNPKELAVVVGGQKVEPIKGPTGPKDPPPQDKGSDSGNTGSSGGGGSSGGKSGK